MKADSSDKYLQYLKHSFDTYSHGQGMNFTSLSDAYKKANVSATPDDIERQIKLSNTKEHNLLDFNEFLAVMDRGDHEESVLKVFGILDRDNDGVINSEDLQQGLLLFGESATDEEIDIMIKAADVDGDGLLNFEEFLKILTPSKINGQ
ncbi:hypothetical protein PHYBLDRAFT_168899 [Phycomyces blakesleeanus NRRL 1555(-)]|uniref:EF-hand domain-containing protein n=1 Tax=Phycomyces blakesleeanus (strain ATCC 8743b / DSM 1359 / FGSC 10004 / NBRC 33097 / NRRL 1555) TaxID=763407 RepID=A0A162XAJ5_PHYB8|nr:hypothetical protein PHYBLDRAFT_168899 [Phycomyces blakesleeanus NRRL 1555(-)]OAD73555.1 hypothetical protein PHYBLDRAFT_168899 [Phycomyces blakesleeanus NRRL 1555(-)]|eukprot:XP_018291595.1 hypothetical protein PHYBLDRAFT_168899 [Phycomyces blakesleeanus NRRL 1555(-)]